jgi:hypothetical protein
MWNHDQCVARIHEPGIYYTVVSLDSVCGNASLWLTVNGERIFQVKAANNGVNLKEMVVLNNGAQTRDNGAVIRLAAGDYLAVEWPEPHHTYCFNNTDTNSIDLFSDYMATFYGVLLSPNIS